MKVLVLGATGRVGSEAARFAITAGREVTQEEFATRYHIPLGTLRDWE